MPPLIAFVLESREGDQVPGDPQPANIKRTDLRIRPKGAQLTETEVEDAITRRKTARAEKDFATSDAIRDELSAKGIELMDGDPLGWEWRLS